MAGRVAVIETVARTFGKWIMKTVPEPDAELLTAEEVLDDVQSLSESLQRRQAERRAYAILNRPAVRSMLNSLIASGTCPNDEAAIEQALRMLVH